MYTDHHFCMFRGWKYSKFILIHVNFTFVNQFCYLRLIVNLQYQVLYTANNLSFKSHWGSISEEFFPFCVFLYSTLIMYSLKDKLERITGEQASRWIFFSWMHMMDFGSDKPHTWFIRIFLKFRNCHQLWFFFFFFSPLTHLREYFTVWRVNVFYLSVVNLDECICKLFCFFFTLKKK